MSDKENDDLGQAKKEVVITPEDCSAALEFWNAFSIPMPDALKNASEAFAKDSSYENQEEFKFQLVAAISESDHEIMKDDIFQEVIKEVSTYYQDALFEKNLKEMLTQDPTDSDKA